MISQPVVRKRGHHRRLSRQLAAVLNSSEADQVIAAALAVLEQRARFGSALTSPGAVRDYLKLSLAAREHEVFVAIWLDAQHRVISMQEMFRGTLTQTAVYARECVKAALAANAAAVIFAHNHPSGVAQPSQADELLTRNLKEVLALVEVRTLDHIIVAGAQALSFAERGLI
jgi:DNA repair protein RadC